MLETFPVHRLFIGSAGSTESCRQNLFCVCTKPRRKIKANFCKKLTATFERKLCSLLKEFCEIGLALCDLLTLENPDSGPVSGVVL